ncbi:unnamed protein product, partial [Nesidiocoris tenuis]
MSEAAKAIQLQVLGHSHVPRRLRFAWNYFAPDDECNHRISVEEDEKRNYVLICANPKVRPAPIRKLSARPS